MLNPNTNTLSKLIQLEWLQIKRELAVEDLEKIQINMAIAEGKTPQELVQAGLTGAVLPSVLT